MTVTVRRCLALLAFGFLLIPPLKADGAGGGSGQPSTAGSTTGMQHLEQIQGMNQGPRRSFDSLLFAEVSCDSPLDFVEILINLSPADGDGRPGGGDDIASIDVCIDYPEDRLSIDCDESDADGGSGGVRFLVGSGLSGRATCQAYDPGCKLKLQVQAEPGRRVTAGQLASVVFALEGGSGRSETLQVQLQNSSARDSLGNGVPLDTTTRSFSVAECCAADCNGDLIIDLADALGTIQELSAGQQLNICPENDKSGAVGRSCCDCNADRQVDVADAVCVALGIGKLGCPDGGNGLARTAIANPWPGAAWIAPGEEEAASQVRSDEEEDASPLLELGRGIAAHPGGTAILPIHLGAGSRGGIPPISVCIDFDQQNLALDTLDADADGIPDGISLAPSLASVAGVRVALDREDCELLFSTSEPVSLSTWDQALATLEFQVVEQPTSVDLPVHCTASDAHGAEGVCSSGSIALPRGVQGPALSLGTKVPASREQAAIMPLFFAQGSDDLMPGGPDDTTAFAVCVDFDPTALDFDASDRDGDGSPDDVVFQLGPQHVVAAQFDLDRQDCELLLTAIDLFPPLATLDDGLAVEIAFEVMREASAEITVGCGDPTVLSFSDTDGRSLDGTCSGGSFSVLECRDEDCDDGNPCNGVETCSATKGCQAGTPLVCDDGIGCTLDSCDPGAGCVFEADDSVCDDGQFCNGAETCDLQNDCQAGAAPVCDDGVGCTLDSCDPDADGGAGACATELDDAACDDGQFCNGAETCSVTKGCQVGTPPVCDDGVGCTLDTCDPDADGGAGACASEADDAACDDGQFCNGMETCDLQNDCQSGAVPVCDDGVDCTLDTCDPDADGGAGACATELDDAACDDGQFCNGAETCSVTKGCQVGTPPVCDDGVGCTLDTCDPDADGGAGACASEADDAACDDGQFCNGMETCDLQNDCQAGAVPVCDDGVDCTLDTCDPDADGGAGACATELDDAACDDGQFCNGAETCSVTKGCQVGTPPVCDDGVGCTLDTCDPDADGGAGACAAEADDAACDDGQFCNGMETCDLQNDCQAGAVPVCDDGVDCTLDTCDPDADGGAGACATELDDAACDDGQFCNGAETCSVTKGCQVGTPPVCDDGVGCTLDTCDPDADGGAGACAAEADDAACDDGQFCNGMETCDLQNDCQAGAAPVCDDGVGCTLDSCDPDADGGAGACASETDDAACDDGQFCNGVETCDLQNDCQAGAVPVCDDGVGCTLDSCDPDADGGAGACATEADDAACDDGQFCNGMETCDLQNDCQSGAAPVCDDGVGCTLDSCDPDADGGAGACASETDDAACDDGQFCNGVETCDLQNDCQAGAVPVCDDGVGCTLDSCDPDADGGAGACATEADDAACDDGQFCNGDETCDLQNDCQSGAAPVCDDGVGCTLDSCDPDADGGAGACAAEADDAACDDGQFCNGVETCDLQNDCQAGAAPVCDDGVGCTLDSCDPDADGDAGACAAEADDAACDDGRFCNGMETCDLQNDCQAGAAPVCDDGVGCTLDSCDPDADGGAGACAAEADDAACDDGQFCNGDETCDLQNDCQAGAAPVCDDGVGCTLDTCDPDADGGAGACAAEADDAACDDGQFCNGVETCDLQNDCQAGAAPVCDDGVGCTLDSCDPDAEGGAGACTTEAEDAACDDGQFCNGVETCDPVKDCQTGAPPVCDDGIGCTIDRCDPAAMRGRGACDVLPDDPACDDGLFCNGTETCDLESDCQAGAPPVVDDGIECTIDFCDDATGSVSHTPDDTFCDDGIDCTIDVCNPNSGCESSICMEDGDDDDDDDDDGDGDDDDDDDDYKGRKHKGSRSRGKARSQEYTLHDAFLREKASSADSTSKPTEPVKPADPTHP